jgi:hypothetical protein
MFRVEDHQHTPVGAEPTALEVGQQVLTHPRVLGRAVPHAERVFLAVSRDAERHDQAGLADMDSVDQQPHQVHRVERGGLPRRHCAAVFVTKRRLTALLLVPRLRIVAGTGSRLRAYRRVATPTSICSTTRRFNGSTSAMA